MFNGIIIVTLVGLAYFVYVLYFRLTIAEEVVVDLRKRLKAVEKRLETINENNLQLEEYCLEKLENK